ncbi:TPR repeat-containing protein [Candidatus Sulfopaludibacter sp. SbA4]|nr:TPR repeat-containing protein [Candidatus Sulfopaludibacter sp. SbA4]
MHVVSQKYLLMAVAGIALAASVYVIGHRELKPERHPPEATYVNSAVCSGCHPGIAKTYALTGMGRSFYRPRAENTVEDYAVRNEFDHRASGSHYAMFSRDGKWFQRRHQIGYDGNQTNILEMQIDYAIGSGNHARSYLHRTAEGKLVELPVTWYSEKNGYWAMSPGYDRPDPSDFRRAISYECFSCHNAYPPALNGEGGDPIFGDAIPEGIDCQRCHGPGSAHIAAASSPRAQPESIRKAIVNPARLNRRQQMEVCMQCHLQTTAIHSPDSIRRFDRHPFSYRPGQPLRDFAVYFDFPSPTDKFEIDHAAYRLSQSACFQKSQMTCTTCHDPHQAVRGADADARYPAICRNCHRSAHGNSGPRALTNCLDCHMPKRRARDVVHAVMTDHYIQRLKPAGDLLAPLAETHGEKSAYRGEVVVYDPAQLASADAELYRAVAQARQQANPDAGIASLQSAIERFHPQEPAFYFELGRACRNAGRREQAIRWLEEALRRRPGFRPAMKELAAALSDSGQLARAAEILEGAGRDGSVLTDLGNVYLQEGRPDQAEQALQQAISLNPDLPAAYNLLGLARLRKGDPAGAGNAFREAIRIQPDLAEARTNLGNLLAASGDLPQAMFHLRAAVESDPGNVEAHFDLAEALAATGSFDKSLDELETTLRLNPNHARAHIDLGRILTMKGLTQKAADHYRRAIEIDSGLADPHYYLGSILASGGDKAEAEHQFRRAVELNPEHYEAHFALGRLLAARGDLQEARSHFETAARSPDPRLRSAASRFR